MFWGNDLATVLITMFCIALFVLVTLTDAKIKKELNLPRNACFSLPLCVKGRIYMAFTLDTYSKSCNSDELQTWMCSFHEVFAGKDIHIFIGEANTGKLTDADYIVAIRNEIKKGNAYVIRGKYLNRLVFGIKKVSFSDAIVNNPSAYQEQVVHDLRIFGAEAKKNMEQQIGIEGIPLIYVCEQSNVNIHDDSLISGGVGDVATLLFKAALQLSKRDNAIDNMKGDVSGIADKVKERCIEKPIPLVLTEVPYRQSHRLTKEQITAEITAFCKKYLHPYIYILSKDNTDWDAQVFFLYHSPKSGNRHTSPMGVEIECIWDMERFYTSAFYRNMDKSEVEIADFKPGEIKKKLSMHSLPNVSYTIRIQGSLNGTDILSLHEYSQNLIGQQSFLTKLDLSKCTLVDGGESYYTSTSQWAVCDCYTKQDILTKFIFNDLYLREIVLPEQVMTMEQYAFYRLPTLETIVSYASILERACICNCLFVRNIVLRNVVKKMSCGAVYQCPNLSTIVFECPQQKLSFVGNSLYTSNKLLLYTNVSSSEYAIPDGTVEIAPSAFYGKSNLKVIHLNDGLKKIGDEAFAQTGISSLHLPITITHIGKLCIPSALKDLYVYAATPCPIAKGTFYCVNNTKLHVPKGTLEKYKQTARWDCFADYIEEDYSAVYTGEICNHVIGSVKGRLTKKNLSETPVMEVENLRVILSFGDFLGTCRTMFEQKKTLFWLLVRKGKLILNETCIKELECLYPQRRKETMLLYRYLSLWSQKKLESTEFSYDEEPSLRDLERDTYYALGGENYEAFMENGGDWDNFMDGLGF